MIYECLFFIAQLNEKEFKSRLVAEEGKLKALLPPESRNVDDVTSKEGEGEEREREGGEGGGGEKEEGEKAGEVAKQIAVVKYLKVSFKVFSGTSLIQTLNGTEEVSILVRCPYFRGIYIYNCMQGKEELSLLERCPHFKSVLREGFHCISLRCVCVCPCAGWGGVYRPDVILCTCLYEAAGVKGQHRRTGST